MKYCIKKQHNYVALQDKEDTAMAYYDKWGFDKDGYNRNGFNKMGFDRDGYNKFGYDIHGYNRQGINQITQRDRDGYDVDGFDINGFNRAGFDRDGFNLDGYDQEGFNRDGFNRDGFDRAGYDKDGFDRDGFNNDGYDRNGFDHNGYDKDGYDREGYNTLGFNRDGYNSRGFNRLGYDKEGYNAQGYNREGYDRLGFDPDGFNKEGYDKDGRDRLGYDHAGIDRWGFDKEGYDQDGFDIYGYDVEGFNILGFDHEGYDRNGVHRLGFSKSDFDIDGYHLYTGYNLQGYDREGFNINGLDKDGYDKEGYDIEGYNRDGYNSKGYNRRGYNRKGFDINGLNSKGFDKDGFDVNGFNEKGYDREGYDVNGYDREGYDRYGYDKKGKERKFSVNDLKPGMTVYHVKYGAGKIKRFEDKKKYVVITYPISNDEFTYNFPGAFRKYLSIEKPINIKNRESSYSEDENAKEMKWYSDLTRYLRGPYTDDALKKASANFKPQTFTYINKSGFWETKEIGGGIDKVYEATRAEIKNLIGNPYFAHVDYSRNHNLYIGKKGVPGYITDWADKTASLYYQYQMYIGNRETNLKLVRDIDFGAEKYIGYRDLYNALTRENGKQTKYADDRLARIIKSNQKNKRVHDIIESIQQNQYEIITQDKESDILVLGCAGSGKTMILMHRIRYMKYNNPDLDMQKILVISPTDILGEENRELSQILDISAIQQKTMISMYSDLISKMMADCFHVENLLDEIEIKTGPVDASLFNESNLAKYTLKIRKILDLNSEESKVYRRLKKNELEGIRKEYHTRNDGYREFQRKYSLFNKAKKELDERSIDDFERVLRRCDQANERIYLLEKEERIVKFIYSQLPFKKESDADDDKEIIDTKTMFRNTRILIQKIDIDELLRFVDGNITKFATASKLIQLFCAFKLDEYEVTSNQLQAVRMELESYSEKQVIAFLHEKNEEIVALEHSPRKAEVLHYIISQKIANKGANSINREHDLDEVGNDIVSFFDEMDWTSGQENPFVEFDKYEQIKFKSNRLKEFESGNKWVYLLDLIFDVIGVSESVIKCLNDSFIFAIAYILQRISGFAVMDKKYIYIDEFQDFSFSELKFIKKTIPNSVINLFGDYSQCINPKGLTSNEQLENNKDFKTYVINENYRNAKAITMFVNDKFGMNMFGIGLEGDAKIVKTILPEPLQKGDRGAIIVADSSDEPLEINGFEIFDFLKEHRIHRDAYNIIPVSMVKGLEFEKVIVIAQGMTKNQQYVACTRAINHLTVVENKANEVCTIESK